MAWYRGQGERCEATARYNGTQCSNTAKEGSSHCGMHQAARPITHGKAGSYTNRGCRCEACTVAAREAVRRYRRTGSTVGA